LFKSFFHPDSKQGDYPCAWTYTVSKKHDMRKHQFKTSFLIALLLVSGATLMAQNTFKTTSKSVIAFYQYLPKDYASNSNKYPVVIFLHGIGERGPNSTNKSKLEGAIPAVAKLGPPRAVRDGKHF